RFCFPVLIISLDILSILCVPQSVRYHTPLLRPHHQTNPSVAVFCSFFSTPGRSVRKKGRLEKSRRYSPPSRNPCTNLYSALRVCPLKACAPPLNNPPRSDRYSNRPAIAKYGENW